MPLEVRRDLRLATTHAMHASIQVVDAMYTLAGASAGFYEDLASPAPTSRRAHVASQHIMESRAIPSRRSASCYSGSTQTRPRSDASPLEAGKNKQQPTPR